MQCPYCKQIHPDQAKFCPVTGQFLTQDAATIPPGCKNCGAEVPAGALFCPVCGSSTTNVPGTREEVSREPKAIPYNPVATVEQETRDPGLEKRQENSRGSSEGIGREEGNLLKDEIEKKKIRRQKISRVFRIISIVSFCLIVIPIIIYTIIHPPGALVLVLH